MSNTQPTTPLKPCPACASESHTRGTVNAGCICGQTSEIKRGPTENGFSTVPASASGGAGFTAIDANDPKDHALVRQVVKRWPKRWRGIDDAKKTKFVEGLAAAHDKAMSTMQDSHDPELAMQAASLVLSAVKTAAVLEGQNQADDHMEEKNARIDEGKATERVEMPVKFIRGTEGEGV